MVSFEIDFIFPNFYLRIYRGPILAKIVIRPIRTLSKKERKKRPELFNHQLYVHGESSKFTVLEVPHVQVE